jgi:hypothetical protein
LYISSLVAKWKFGDNHKINNGTLQMSSNRCYWRLGVVWISMLRLWPLLISIVCVALHYISTHNAHGYTSQLLVWKFLFKNPFKWFVNWAFDMWIWVRFWSNKFMHWTFSQWTHMHLKVHQWGWCEQNVKCVCNKG